VLIESPTKSSTFPSVVGEPPAKLSNGAAEAPPKEQTFPSVIDGHDFPAVLDAKPPPHAADVSQAVGPRVPPVRPRSTPPAESNLKFKPPSFAAIEQRQRRKGAERRKAPERPHNPEFSPKLITSSGFYVSKTPLPDFSLAVRSDQYLSGGRTRYH
jgi:hypothetical protein